MFKPPWYEIMSQTHIKYSIVRCATTPVMPAVRRLRLRRQEILNLPEREKEENRKYLTESPKIKVCLDQSEEILLNLYRTRCHRKETTLLLNAVSPK